MHITILRFDTLGSTNDEAANHARKGADEGLCIIARQQTAGRGRHGRSWASEPDAGLYFSIVLRPKIGREQLGLITLMAGVAVHDTLYELGLSPDIKWVNDLLVNEKKISGILAEAVETPTGLAVILGIGINLTSGNFPDEIAETATSIASELSVGVSAPEVESALVKFLTYWYEMTQDDLSSVVAEWQRRSTYAHGKQVRVTLS
ncbi:MAG: biotin--[acetyl-CoA-carboxylase] ligase, partial [Pyrinomonadaceae bacterium]|nr:biotin--[acetyl-CoA-carboxylase] ligase [Pyrinomonadaceae bacterium]